MTRRFLGAFTALFTLAIFPVPYGIRGLKTEKLLDDLVVGLGQDLVGVEARLTLRRLDLEVVAHAGLLLHDLAGASDLEPLLRPGMGLHLRHLFPPVSLPYRQPCLPYRLPCLPCRQPCVH